MPSEALDSRRTSTAAHASAAPQLPRRSSAAVCFRVRRVAGMQFEPSANAFGPAVEQKLLRTPLYFGSR